jgi:hypothetical protein
MGDEAAGHHYRQGRGTDAAHLHDQALFARLLEQHAALRRVTISLPNGIRVQTLSDDPALASVLWQHVEGMHARFAGGRAIRSWDPLFSALFEFRDQVEMRYHQIPGGVEAVLTAADPKLVALIHAHDETLHAFVDRGFEASQHASPVPDWVRVHYGLPPEANASA